MTSTEKRSNIVICISDESFDTEKKRQEVSKQPRSQLKSKKASDLLILNVEKNIGFVHPRLTSKRSVPELVVVEPEGYEALNASMNSKKSSPEDDIGSVEAFQDLKFLQDPITCATLPRTAMAFLRMIPPCLVAGLSWIGWTALNSIGFLACNKSGDPVLTSTLSLTIFLNALTLASMNYGLMDKAGITMSQAYGAKDFRRFKKYFCQSLLLGVSFSVLIGIPLMIFIKDLLLILQIMPDLASSIQSFYWKFAMMEILKMFVDFFMVVANAQGIETTFFALMMMNTIVSGSFMCFLCFYIGLVLDGLIYAMLMFHCNNLIIFAKVYFFECDAKTRGVVTMSEAMDGFGGFVMDWFKYFIGTWIEWLGWESSSYFVALIHDIHQVAAFGSLINFAYFCFLMVTGLKFGARTRISYLLSRGYDQAAKRFFRVHFICLIILSIPLGLIVFMTKGYIADFYAGNIPETRAYLVDLLTLFSILISADPIFGLVTVTARIIDHVNFSIAVTLVFIIGLMGATHYRIVRV